MSKEIKIITDTAALAKEAVNLAANVTKLDKRIQVYLCSEIAHIEIHRNPTRLNQFFAAVKGTGTRTHAMHMFIQTFCNVKYHETEKDVAAGYRMLPQRDKAIGDKMLADAIKTDWTAFKPEGKVVQFDLAKRAEQFLFDAFKAGVEIDDIKAAIDKVETIAKDRVTKAINEASLKAKREAAKAEPAKEMATKA